MSHVFKIGIAAKNNKEIKEVNHIDVIANKGVVSERGKSAPVVETNTSSW